MATACLLPATTDLNLSLAEYCFRASALSLGEKQERVNAEEVCSYMLATDIPGFSLLLHVAFLLRKSDSGTGLAFSIRSNCLRAKAGGSKK